MEEQEKVWRHLTALGGKAARGAVVAALTVSMMPISAFAYEGTEAGSTATNTVPASAQAEGQTPSNGDYTAVSPASEGDKGSSTYDLSKIADGLYAATVTVSDDGATIDGVSTGVEDDEFAGYTLTVNVTVADHKITKVEVFSTASSESTSYVDKATNGKKNASGVPAKIVDAQSVDVDNVSSATVSSLAIKAATAKALANAPTGTDPVEDEYIYGYAALTWAEYWAAEGVQNAGSTETSDVIDAHGETDKGAFDVVTRATANHGLHRGSYQCTATIKCTDGTEFSLATWAEDGKSFTTTDGKTVEWNRGQMTCDGQSYTMAEYDVEGLKYVPVKVKSADLDAFKAAYSFVENGGTLAGGYGEKNLSAYSVTAEVDADTNGLKAATKNADGTFTFGAAAAGTGSGIQGQALKAATGIEPTVRRNSVAGPDDDFNTGGFGEFLRVDLNGDYGDLAANMQSVTWTYYGNDSTYSSAVATYGTKFAADNWMHKMFGIQLGLTESERCQLPSGYDGTGYWKITVHALGYEDYTYTFQATSENIADHTKVSDETRQKLQDLYDKAAALKKDDYTAESWEASGIETELGEAKELLESENLEEVEASEQVTHLQAAIDALVAVTPVEDEYTYGYAALTWAEYWAAEGVQNAGSTETSDVIDAHGETDKGAFDVVTRATANHGLHRGSYQCTATIKCTDGTEFSLATWAEDGKSFTTTDGKTVEWNRGQMTCDGQSYTMAEYDVEGLKYVPVKVKSADLDAFKAAYSFVENGGTLAGGYGEKNLSAYSVTAEVDADTNGLKAATKNADGTFTFGAAAAGTGSGIQGQDQKVATGIEPTVKTGDGSYGEFLRVDLNGDYGDLGANMQAVTWTYYGSDSTRTNALATYGTKFAADNWMHKSMGIQLGLTESARCQLPEGTDGTGYWTLTVHALGYADYTYDFEATSENIAAPKAVSDSTKASLQALADTANAKVEGNYTAETWASFATELDETNELLAKENLTESEARTQISHLTEAMNALVRTAPEAGSYVLMNIPYSDFYAAETANNDTKVDVFTSATKNKPKNTGLAGGTYHTEDGSEISGITFAVKVSDDAAEKIDWSKLTRAESTDALAEAGSYTYVILGEDEAPATYKQLSVAADGSLAFGVVEGAEATQLDGSAEAKFTTESNYGDYELDFKADSSVYAALKDATIYGAVLNTTDGTGYGLRHLENIWKTGKHGVEFAWCTGFTDTVHGCPTSSEHYASIMGKTLSGVTVYTSAGTYEISLGEDGVYVPVKTADATIDAADVLLDDGTELAVEVNLPEGFDPEYSIDGTVVEPSQGRASLSFDVSSLKPGSHTIKATDKSGKYAVISDAFVASTSKVVAQYQDGKLVKAEGASDEEFANFLANVTSVKVGDTAYSASGRGSVKIVDSDGTILTSAASGQGDAAKKVFDGYGSYDVSVSSTGYGALDFTFDYEAEKGELKQAIADAAKLEESNYSTATWSAYQQAIAGGQAVVDNVSATDDEVSAAVKAIADAKAALAPSPRISLNEAISNAQKLSEADYTKASWKTFQAALDAAKKVAADATATDAQVQAARDALVNAQTALATAATSDQKTNLKVEIGRADVLNESDYTADSWKAYQAALAAAKKVAASDDASAAEVAQANDALAAARKALTKKSAEQASSETQQAGASNGDAATTSGNDSGKKTPKTSDASLAVSGVAGLGAALTGIAAAIRRRFRR